MHSGAPRGRRVHTGSGWFTQALLAVVAIIRVCVGTFERTFGFNPARLGVVVLIRVLVGSLGRV